MHYHKKSEVFRNRKTPIVFAVPGGSRRNPFFLQVYAPVLTTASAGRTVRTLSDIPSCRLWRASCGPLHLDNGIGNFFLAEIIVIDGGE